MVGKIMPAFWKIELIFFAICVIMSNVGLISNFIGAWLSLVERCVRDAEVVGSNPVAPIFLYSFLGGKEETA